MKECWRGTAKKYGKDAAAIFLEEFFRNFSSKSDGTAVDVIKKISPVNLSLNCDEAAVIEAIKSCSRSSSSSDRISFNLLKTVAGAIIKLLNITCQQSFYQGEFPAIWKHAIVVPLYKGHGIKLEASSYRPISICSCLSKVMEHIVFKQLITHLNGNDLLCRNQHGFMRGKSTFTNLLSFDAHIVNYQLSEYPFDVVTFDFKKAFEKVPYDKILQELAVRCINVRELQ